MTRREQSDKAMYSNPRFFLQKPTEVFRVFYIMVEVCFFHLPIGVMTWASGVEGGAPLAIRCSTFRRRSALGNKSGSPDALYTIFFPDNILLFCECQHDKFYGLEVAFSVCGPKDAAAATEGDVFESEQVALLFGRHVFTGVEYEEVSSDDHIAF